MTWMVISAKLFNLFLKKFIYLFFSFFYLQCTKTYHKSLKMFYKKENKSGLATSHASSSLPKRCCSEGPLGTQQCLVISTIGTSRAEEEV